MSEFVKITFEQIPGKPKTVILTDIKQAVAQMGPTTMGVKVNTLGVRDERFINVILDSMIIKREPMAMVNGRLKVVA